MILLLLSAALVASQLETSHVTASSTLPKWKDYTFAPANLADGRLETSWQPKSARGGVGERFQIEFPTSVRVEQCSIANGLQLENELGDLFLLNSRIRSARMVFSDDSSLPIEFDALARGAVKFTVPNKVTRTIRVVVDSVFEGAGFKDLAVSEIRCEGEAVVEPLDRLTRDQRLDKLMTIGWELGGDPARAKREYGPILSEKVSAGTIDLHGPTELCVNDFTFRGLSLETWNDCAIDEHHCWRVNLTENRVELPFGIRIGATATAVMAALGPPTWEGKEPTTLSYSVGGMWMGMANIDFRLRDGRVEQIDWDCGGPQ